MKLAQAKIPFLVNEQNMTYLLKGNKIVNLKEVHEKLINNNDDNIYEVREDGYTETEYPNINDRVVAKKIGYSSSSENDCLDIEIIDSLYFSKLRVPCIKVNGYCIQDETGGIRITKVTRLTLADMAPSSNMEMIL